jgi:hypothetical protein
MSATTFANKYAPAFQVTTLTAPVLPTALASLVPLSFASGIPSANWVAQMGEAEPNFRARITADLAASGPAGALVYIYENGNSWVRRGYSDPPLEDEGF